MARGLLEEEEADVRIIDTLQRLAVTCGEHDHARRQHVSGRGIGTWARRLSSPRHRPRGGALARSLSTALTRALVTMAFTIMALGVDSTAAVARWRAVCHTPLVEGAIEEGGRPRAVTRAAYVHPLLEGRRHVGLQHVGSAMSQGRLGRAWAGIRGQVVGVLCQAAGACKRVGAHRHRTA